MNKNIEQALAAFSYDEQRRMRDVITALDNGKVYSVEFYSDGSGVSFEYYHPTINPGCPVDADGCPVFTKEHPQQ